MTALARTDGGSNGRPRATAAAGRSPVSPLGPAATAGPAPRDLLEPEWDWMAAWGRYLAQRARTAAADRSG